MVVRFCPSKAGERYGRVAGQAGPRRLRDRVTLRDQRSGRRKIATPGRSDAERVEVDRQNGQQARLADALQLPDENRLPGLLVPELARGPPGRVPPSRSLIHRGLFLGKDARRASQHWRRGDASLGDQDGKAVQ